MATAGERDGDEGLWLVIVLYGLSGLLGHPVLWLIPAILLVVMLTRHLPE